MKTSKITLTDVIPIDFSWLGKIKLGVKDYLESKKMKWDSRIQGIIKNYCKIRIIEKKARILEDVGIVLVHVRYTMNFYSPKLGDQLEAVIKTWTDSSIGGLVGDFNLTLDVEGCKFDGEKWKDLNEIEVKRDSKASFILEK